MKAMMNKTNILLLLCLIIGQFAHAQVTGNIKLVDMYGTMLTDHSGTMVVFEPRSGGAVQDTVYTDVNGDFSISLTNGEYRVVYKNNGYGAKWFPKSNSPSSWIQTPNYSLPFDTIYGIYPIDSVTLANSGSGASGTLQPFTRYRFKDSLVVEAGDTLTIPEGSILDSYGTYGITVYGCLQIIGSSTNPAWLASLDSGYAGYDVYQTQVVVLNGGTLKIENAFSPTTNLNVFRGNVSMHQTLGMYEDVLNQPTIDPQSFGPTSFNLDEANLEIEESNLILLELNASVSSRIDISCSMLIGDLNCSSNTKVYLTGSYFDAYQSYALDMNGIDSLVMLDNMISQACRFRNTLSNDTSIYILRNNNSRYGETSVSDRLAIHAINNIGFYFTAGNNPIQVVFNELQYNIFYNILSSTIPYQYLPIGPTYPAGVIPVINNNTDTIDVLNNRYSGNPGLQYNNGSNQPFSVIPSYLPFVQNTGDPSYLDLDGSRSDRGARYAGCSNLRVLQPSGPITTPIDSVYPGDANYDGVCDNADLLPIGYMYGQTGPLRVGASLAWVGQYADPWASTLPNGQNAKHSDCDGSGLVDYDDVAAIYQNFALTHQIPKQPFGDGLWLQFPSDSIFEGDTIEVGIMLGTNQNPVTGISGLAFSINYDPAFIKRGSARMTFDNCWMGTDSVDLVTFNREDTTVHRVDVALSRTDRVQLSGSGSIGTLIVVINDDIQAKDSMTLTTFMDFSNILAKNASYSDITLGSSASTVNVQVGYDRLASSIDNVLTEMNVSVYPNPAQSQLNVSLPANSNGTLTLYNLQGKAVATALATENSTMDVSHLDNGMYLLSIQLGNEMLTYKISVRR